MACVRAITRRATLMGMAALLPRRAAADVLQLLGGAGSSGTGVGSTFPIRASSNGRYFVTAQGQPWLMVADSACSVSRIIRSQIQTYVSTRASQGFNTLQIDCVTPNYGGLNPNGIATDEGYTPWGATPFTTYETVNYWPKIDWIVQLCASYNILAFLNPYLQGGNSDLGNAGVAAATAYGTFLGNRYKNSPNVMWYFGNDYVVGSTTDFNAETALLQAIRNAGDTHMRTMEVGLGTGNGDWSFEEVAGGYGSFAANLEINGVYSAAPLYAPMISGYNAPSVSFAGQAGTNRTSGTPAPIIMLESGYEFGHTGGAGYDYGTRVNLRREAYSGPATSTATSTPSAAMSIRATARSAATPAAGGTTSSRRARPTSASGRRSSSPSPGRPWCLTRPTSSAQQVTARRILCTRGMATGPAATPTTTSRSRPTRSVRSLSPTSRSATPTR